MGLFNEETQQQKEYKELIKAIKNSNLSYYCTSYLVDYVQDIRDKKRNNDFYDFEFLRGVILEILSSTEDYAEDDVEKLENYLSQLVENTKFLLPQGEKTENYEKIKNLIIINLSNKKGLIGKGIFDKKFYSIFDNIDDYLYIMNIIASDPKLIENFDNIIDFSSQAASWTENGTLLKREIISYINELNGVLSNPEEYKKKRIEEIKKRFGIYPGIDESTLSVISSEIDRFNGLVTELEVLERKIYEYTKTVDTKTKRGIEDIDNHSKAAATKIRKELEILKQELQQELTTLKKQTEKELEDYLKTLEISLKQSSDEVFKRILRDTEEKLRSLRLAAQGLTTTSNTELLRLQQASQESLEALRSYVENTPQLQEMLTTAATDEKIREALLKFNEARETTVVTGQIEPKGIIIPGSDRLIIPANGEVILPENYGNIQIIPSFDESIAFDTRIKAILAEKQKREENGEIFHSMTEEVIRCVMEGDWPYLYGPSGCGKSYLIKQVAELIGIDLIDNGKITDKYSIMGYNDAHGKFRATQAFVASIYGKLLSLDEFDNGNTDTQVILNELYSGLLDVLENPNKPRYITFAEDVRVPIHPNFRMISAGNTKGSGENPVYSSRGKIDESVQERMTPKKFDYDNKVEQRIFGDYKAWYDIFVKFRQICTDYAKKIDRDSPEGITTTRDAAAIVKYINHNSKKVDQIMREKFVQTKDASYLKYIRQQLITIYGIDEDTKLSNKALQNMTAKELGKRLVLACDNAIGDKK